MYAKLFASLYQGTLRGCSDEILVFTNLLAHADKYGIVDKHYRAIAEETGLPDDRVRAAIAMLESPDPESRSPEMEGRRIVPIDEHRAWGWQIVNHGKYRAIKNEDDRRDQNRKAQQKWREKQNKQNKPSVSTRKQGVSTRKQDKPIQIQIQRQITEEEGEKKPPPTAADFGEPQKIDPMSLHSHPAIEGLRLTTGYNPPKESRSLLASRMGDEVDLPKLFDTVAEWRAAGNKATNFTGIVDWYLGQRKNGVKNGSKPTTPDVPANGDAVWSKADDWVCDICHSDACFSNHYDERQAIQ